MSGKFCLVILMILLLFCVSSWASSQVGHFYYPFKDGQNHYGISQGFLETNPANLAGGTPGRHLGVDIPCPRGTDLYVTGICTIAAFGEKSDWGKYVIMAHFVRPGNGYPAIFYDYFAHMSSFDPSLALGKIYYPGPEGGSPVGKSGNTGNVKNQGHPDWGYHLHWGCKSQPVLGWGYAPKPVDTSLHQVPERDVTLDGKGTVDTINYDPIQVLKDFSFYQCLKVVSTYPANKTCVAKPFDTITVIFSEPFDAVNFNQSMIKITPATPHSPVGCKRGSSPDCLLIQSFGRLLPNTRYTVELASSIQSEAGHTLGAPYSFEFFTDSGAWKTDTSASSKNANPTSSKPSTGRRVANAADDIFREVFSIPKKGQIPSPSASDTSGDKKVPGIEVIICHHIDRKTFAHDANVREIYGNDNHYYGMFFFKGVEHQNVTAVKWLDEKGRMVDFWDTLMGHPYKGGDIGYESHGMDVGHFPGVGTYYGHVLKGCSNEPKHETGYIIRLVIKPVF